MDQKYSDITGIILAGGKSSRMAMNKALLKIDGRTSLQIILEKVNKIFEHVLISSNDSTLITSPTATIIPDIFFDHGPLSGVHAGLTASQTQKVFFIPCDLPLMSIEMIQYLVEFISDDKNILPRIKNIPTYDFGIYSRSFLSEIEKQFNTDGTNPSLRKLINPNNTIFVEVEKLSLFHEEFFLNMNKPEDYEKVRSLFTSHSELNDKI